MKKHTIEYIREIAKERGGKCLSTKYVNNGIKLKWQCGKGHTWNAPYGRIQKKMWCPTCSGKMKLTLAEMQQIAKSRHGKCLSKKYINSNTSMEWECNKGHCWKTSASNIRRGHWCYYCARITNGLKLRITLSEMQKIAESKGGHCLSNSCEGTLNKLKWKCMDGHIWKAIPSSIKAGSWCPFCKRTNESKCRFIIEQLLNTPLPKSRKIISPLELDGYSKKHHLAFEFQGEQHYKKAWYHKSQKEFKHQQKRDRKKLRLCQQNKIILLVIPHWEATTDNKLIKFIKTKLMDFGFHVNKKINWTSFAKYSSLLTQVCEIIKKKKGNLLDYKHVGNDVNSSNNIKVYIECQYGHLWQSTPYYLIKRGSWCRNCINRKYDDKLIINT